MRAAFQWTAHKSDDKERIKRQVFVSMFKEMEKHFADEVRLKELDTSILYNQLELELYMFTPQGLSEFIEKMALPEERFKMQHRLHEAMNNQSKIKFK